LFWEPETRKDVDIFLERVQRSQEDDGSGVGGMVEGIGLGGQVEEIK
jgi:hypothetical protein